MSKIVIKVSSRLGSVKEEKEEDTERVVVHRLKNGLGDRDTVLPSANAQHSNPEQTLPRAFTLAWNKASGQMMERS